MTQMKTLFIIRGIPGSGKSTLARHLAGQHLEADMYFVKDGKYQFDPSKLKEAHAWCRQAVRELMEAGEPTVAVANTFTQLWEMQDYRDLAEEYGYGVFAITCENEFGNVHGVPPDKVAAMWTRWERIPRRANG